MEKGDRKRPIGVFDSGVGGLTVLRALRSQLPAEDFVYLGDTARVPYGTKSAKSVTRYALQAARVLVDRGIKQLVVACNTASAVALEALEAAYRPLPVVGVVEPGAEACCRLSVTGHVAVIGTEGTIRGGAYQRAIRRFRPDARIVARPCSLFVALAEEGWVRGELVEAIVARYLEPILGGGSPTRPDCLVLGCTHFPPLSDAIRSVAGAGVTLVDSAETTAVAVKNGLEISGLLNAGGEGKTHFLATDGIARFCRVGEIFLGEPISPETVELVDL